MNRLVINSILFLLSFTSVFSQKNIGDSTEIKRWEIGIEGGMCLYKNNKLCDNIFAGYGVSVPISYAVSERVNLGIRISSYFGVFNRSGSYYHIDQQFSDIAIACFSKFKFPIGKKSGFYLMPVISNNTIILKNAGVFLNDDDRLSNKYFQYEIGAAIGFEYKLNKTFGLSANYLFNYSQFFKFKNELNVGLLINM